MMGFFSKLFGSSADTVTDVKEVVAEDVVDAITGKAEATVELAKEVVEKKKDSCCGGNCGS